MQNPLEKSIKEKTASNNFTLEKDVSEITTQKRREIPLDIMRQDLLDKIQVKKQNKGTEEVSPVTPHSDKRLTREYTSLQSHKSSQSLLDQVSRNTSSSSLTLIDSSRIPHSPTEYQDDKHALLIPAFDKIRPRRSTQVKADILIEVSNARNREWFRNLKHTFAVSEPNSNASPSEMTTYQKKRAIFALAAEWSEWSNNTEVQQRMQLVNADSPTGTEIVAEIYAARYQQADQGWYQFRNYLTEQIETGHTSEYYDKNATRNNYDNWAGKKYLEQVALKNPRALHINQRQLEAWENMQHTRLYELESNPFLAPEILRDLIY